MRIRTATAAAVLATAALLGSAGTAFAGGGDHYSETKNSNNRVHWEKRVNDFTQAVLSRRTSVSDNDTAHSQDWRITNISDNFVGNFSGGVRQGDFVQR